MNKYKVKITTKDGEVVVLIVRGIHLATFISTLEEDFQEVVITPSQ